MTARDVIIQNDGCWGHITLNRPQAMHALTLDMCQEMLSALSAWEENTEIEAVMIDHSAGRGFCAGGDLRQLHDRLMAEDGDLKRFFYAEYQVNHLLFTYSKPSVVFMHGVVMGGGAGIAMPCRFRIATEATMFAMPEVGIGFFPDVGGSWYLSRLPGRIGQWLALTGARLSGADCISVGLATHYVEGGALPKLKADLRAQPYALESIVREASVSPPLASIEPHRADIARLFASDRLEDVVAALETDASEWAARQLNEIDKKSPRSCKIALRQLAEGKSMPSFAEAMRMEYRLAVRLVRNPDFAEGIRAFVIDKNHDPKWQPPLISQVNDGEIAEIFAALPTHEEWRPLRERDDERVRNASG
jgi:enoyl-CoA hydratase